MAKIVIVGTAWPYRGGMAVYNERLAQALSDAGHDVDIVTFTLQYPSFLVPGKTQFADWEYKGNIRISRAVNSINPFNWFFVGKRLQRLKFDIVIIPFWLPFMGPCFGSIARLIKKNKHSKIISIIHNAIPHEHRMGDRIFTRWFLKSIDAFVVMSKKVFKDLESFNVCKPALFTPHPLYDNFGEQLNREFALTKLKLSEEYRYALFFGLIRDYKGLDLLIEAMADRRFEKLKVKLLVAGEFYSDSEKYFQQIKDLGIENRILVYPVSIPDNLVNQYFGAADIVVQPYKNATQSGVTQIAYHFDKPMIVTNVGGLGEIVPNNKVGYVVDVSSGAIADALIQFFELKQPNYFLSGLLEEKKKYSWHRMSDTITELVHQIDK